MDFYTIFSIALISSLGHCVGMCGGIVIAYSNLFNYPSLLLNFLSHIIYSLGRVSSYSCIGLISAFIGNTIGVDSNTKGIIFIVVGIIMLLIGISILIPKLSSFLEVNIFKIKFFNKLLIFFIKQKNLSSLYFVGILNGFIPCGIVYFFVLSASVSPSLIDGVLVMLIFGFATCLPMIAFGMFSSLIHYIKYRKTIVNISALLIIIFGLKTIYNGLTL